MGREVYATPRLPRGSSWTPGMPIDRLRIFPASPIVRGPMTESKGTVLVVDDEEAVRQVASDILGYLRRSVETSASGQASRPRTLQGARPDRALLALLMPGMARVETF